MSGVSERNRMRISKQSRTESKEEGVRREGLRGDLVHSTEETQVYRGEREIRRS